MKKKFYINFHGESPSIILSNLDNLKEIAGSHSDFMDYMEIEIDITKIKRIMIKNYSYFVNFKTPLVRNFRIDAFALIDDIDKIIADTGISHDKEACEKLLLEEAGQENIKKYGLSIDSFITEAQE